MARHGLAEAVDAVVFCTDTGYRKPAPQGFHRLCSLLDVTPGGAVFIGDDPRWDIVGPRAIGMDALLINRKGTCEAAHLTTLADLPARLGRL
ncbi:MAG: HAD family hydrolase [Planctomycetota bacterium]